MNIDHVIQVNLLHTIVEPKCRSVYHTQALIAAAWDRNNTITMLQSRGVLERLEVAEVLWFDPKANMWRIVIYGEGNDVLCPVCGEALVGTAKEIYYECSLAPDGDNDEIYVETFDAKDRESELIEVVCKGCGLTVPNEMIDFRGTR